MTKLYTSLVKKYVRFTKALNETNLTNYNRFIKWLYNFIHLKANEHKFIST